jgi:large subunit ribosomal protein L23
MGLFGKKAAPEAETAAPARAAKKPVTPSYHDANAVIVRPRITEKAALLLERNVYTFEVRKGTTKYEVRDAIKALYKVTPVSVRIVNQEPRHYKSVTRGRSMMDNGLRKAYVYLKKGDSINLA